MRVRPEPSRESVGRGEKVLITVSHLPSPKHERYASTSENVRFFVRHGILPALSVPRYHFAILKVGEHPLAVELPTHSRVRVYSMPNHGYEFSNFKRFLCIRFNHTARHEDAVTTAAPGIEERDLTCEPPAGFGYFIFLLDTTRGPFLPSFVRPATWPDALTGMLDDETRLLGPTINCMYCHRDLKACSEALHSQGHMVTTDRVGLGVLLHHWLGRPQVAGWSGGWWHDQTKQDAIRLEIRGTPAMLAAGYNVAVMQRFWRGHDFRRPEASQRRCQLMGAHARDLGANTSIGMVNCPGCNWGMTDLSPYELMFVHHSVSPKFRAGAAKDYTEMLGELDQLEAADPAANPAHVRREAGAGAGDDERKSWRAPRDQPT